MTVDITKYNLANLPPASDKDAVGKFAQKLYDEAVNEKKRQKIPEKLTYSYTMYRGDHWQRAKMSKKNKSKITINLFFSNVNRTVSNITARRPVAEVVDLQKAGDNLANLFTARLKKWWKDTKQQGKLKRSALQMEKYGITVEHALWHKKKRFCEIEVCNPFSVFPAPGNWENFDEKCPYFCYAYAQPVEIVEKENNLEPNEVKVDAVYSTLGEYRENKRPQGYSQAFPHAPESGNYEDRTMHPVSGDERYTTKRALVVWLWIRDKYTKDKDGNKKYPDDIRVIKFTNKGDLVLDDDRNPGVHWNLKGDGEEGEKETLDVVNKTHAWGRFPFYKVNSYLDTTTHWGFSALDQVGDLNKKVDEIMSRILAWIMRVMFPTLVIAKETGIRREQINSRPNLILMPEKVEHVAGIKYVEVPNLPSNFMDVLQLVLNFFDRIYQIEDADRGIAPKGVIAASAIVALQERNAVLMAEKITSVDELVENRGKWAMSYEQNFGKKQTVEIDGETESFRATDFTGRELSYVVESGSTMPKTSLQIEEQAKDLYDKGVIDRRALLEVLNFPNWQKIIERAGEGQVDQALQILIDAGLPEEQAMALKEFVMQPEQGPGDTKKQAGSGPQPAGKPMAARGKTPPAQVTQHPSVKRTA